MDAVVEAREALCGLGLWLAELDSEGLSDGFAAECVATWAADLCLWLDAELGLLESEMAGDLPPVELH